MAEHDFNWFLANQAAYDSLTVEQLHVLGNGGVVDYDPAAAQDTAAQDTADQDAAAQDTADQDAAAQDAAAQDAAAQDAAAQDIAAQGTAAQGTAAQDTATDRIAQLEALVKEQGALIESLKEAKAADAGTGDTAAQDELFAELKEQYPELAAALAPSIEKLVASRVADVEKKLTEALAPLKEESINAAMDAHFAAIAKAVPDYEAIVESGKLHKWVEALPAYARPGAENVLKAGNAADVIELLTQYKQATAPAPAPATPSPEELARRAKQVIDKAAKGAPVRSLSDVPAGSVEVDKVPVTVTDWSQRFAKMTPEQIRKELTH